MTDLGAGLRRRSPNPNSPIPYSPALLSPYVHPTSTLGPNSALGYNDPLERYHLPSPQPGPTPTIRLVGPNAPISPARLAARSHSDEQHVRQSTVEASTASLRRHGTDPKSYPSLIRDAHLFPRDPRDRPVPPLPLNIRRHSHLSTYQPPPVHIHHVESPSTASSPLSTPRTVVSSLKSLRNPFRRQLTTPSSPATSSRTMKTTKSNSSLRSSDSRSSTSTLAVAFHPTGFYSKFATDEKGVGQTLKGKDMGLPGELRMTNKFPGKFNKEKKERWTGFKLALLVSVITVSPAVAPADEQLFGYGLAGLIWAMSILLRGGPNLESG
jgi:hypothetical protein